MSAIKSGSSLRSLLLTPERIPDFLIPSRSPLLSPRPPRSCADRTRLLSDHDDDSPRGSPAEIPLSPAVSPRSLLRLPPRIGAPRRGAAAASADSAAAASADSAAAASADSAADTDLTTRAAMSLPHVRKVLAPYGFRAVLAASPCTRRRESMFHRNKRVTVTDAAPPGPAAPPAPPGPAAPPAPPGPAAPPPPARPRGCPRPVKALGLQVLRELRRPAAALKARSPGARRAESR